MRDGIPKGTGNSRLIKSNDTIPIDFTAFRNQLISTGIPIDLLLNEEGWNILGDFLRKAFFLADDTAAALGGVETVNEALRALAFKSTIWGAFLRNTFDYDYLKAIGEV